MMMKQKTGGFVIHNGHSKDKQKGQYSSPCRNEMMEVLLFYKDVEYIRSSIKRGKNYVDYIMKENYTCRDSKKNIHLTKRIQLYKLSEILPENFIQVNQSEIINVFHIVGRSGIYLFTDTKEFKITDTCKEQVNLRLSTFFH